MSRFRLDRFGGWPALALLTGILVLLAAPVLTYPLGRDQGEFATIGRWLLEGVPPYTGLWNPKPPAIFYTYAAAMRAFGNSALAIRALDLLLLPAMAATLFAIGKRWRGVTVGLWAVLLWGVFYFTETFWTLSQNDGVASLPMALAVLCALHAADGGRHGVVLAGLSGALCALALWFKYPFVAFILALILAHATVLPTRRDILAQGVAFAVGGLIVGLGGMAYMVSIGAMGALWESALVTSGYTAQGFADFRASFANYIGFRWQHWHVLWLLAALWFPLQALQNDTQSHLTGRTGWRIIVAWLMGSIAALLMQARGYDYHWLPMLPPLALLAADTLTRLPGLLRVDHLPGLVAVVAVALLALLPTRTWGTALPYLLGNQTQAEYYARFQGGEFVADESLAVVEYLRERTDPGHSLFIWGFRPEVYYLADLRPASRFIFQFPLVADWYPTAWQQQTVDGLWGALPPYVLVLRGDFMPWVTGEDADSNTLLQDYTELNNWLMFNYEPETEIGNFLIWRLKPQQP